MIPSSCWESTYDSSLQPGPAPVQGWIVVGLDHISNPFILGSDKHAAQVKVSWEEASWPRGSLHDSPLLCKRKGLIGHFAAVKEAAPSENECAQGQEETGCLTGTYLITHSNLLAPSSVFPHTSGPLSMLFPYLQYFSLLHLLSTYCPFWSQIRLSNKNKYRLTEGGNLVGKIRNGDYN